MSIPRFDFFYDSELSRGLRAYREQDDEYGDYVEYEAHLAALAAKDAEIAAMRAERDAALRLLDSQESARKGKVAQDTARLDKLPACFHMLRTLPGDGLAGWWLSYAPNNVYSDVRDAIDAHQEPK